MVCITFSLSVLECFLFLIFFEQLSAGPEVPPAPIAVGMNDSLSPREVRLSWNAIPEFQRNGEILFYEVQIFDPRQMGSRKKREDLKPNSIGACFLAAEAMPLFTLSVPGNMTTVDVSGLSK